MPGAGIFMSYVTPSHFLLNKICLNQTGFEGSQCTEFWFKHILFKKHSENGSIKAKCDSVLSNVLLYVINGSVA